MSYTMTLKSFLEKGYVLPLDNYPIFDETYREILNNKITDYFIMKEIGFETPELFILKFRMQMQIIMPRINMIYDSYNEITSLLENINHVDVLQDNFDRVENNKFEGDGNNFEKTASSDTPKNLLEQEDLDGNYYADRADLSQSKNNTSNTTDNTIKDLRNTTKTLIGKDGEKSNILFNLKTNLYDVDMLVMDGLKEMFMLIY